MASLRRPPATDHVRVDADGRPDQVTPAAGSTEGLELVTCPTRRRPPWTGLAVTLRWRLPATLAGAERPAPSTCTAPGSSPRRPARWTMTPPAQVESDGAARRPVAQTSGQLRVALRRAVIAADPEGAEQRRQEAQRHAKVSLYPDPADGHRRRSPGTRLPAVHAAAAKTARLTAIARAMKSAGEALAAWTTCAPPRSSA